MSCYMCYSCDKVSPHDSTKVKCPAGVRTCSTMVLEEEDGWIGDTLLTMKSESFCTGTAFFNIRYHSWVRPPQ